MGRNQRQCILQVLAVQHAQPAKALAVWLSASPESYIRSHNFGWVVATAGF
jgi:hypothetical protein